MFLSAALLSATFFDSLPPVSLPRPQSVFSSMEFAFKLNAGPNLGLREDGDGGLEDYPVFGFEAGTGFVAYSEANRFFLALDAAYTSKVGETEIQMVRGGILGGPSFSLGDDRSFRIGAGIGISSAISGGSSGSSFTIFSMLGYFFPLDDYKAGVSFHYAYNISPLTISEKTLETQTPGLSSPTRVTYVNTMNLHDFGIKVEWQVPFGPTPPRPKKKLAIDEVFTKPADSLPSKPPSE